MNQLDSFSTIERQLLVTARKIREFKLITAQQRALGMTDEYLQSSNEMLHQLEDDFKKLSEALLAIPA